VTNRSCINNKVLFGRRKKNEMKCCQASISWAVILARDTRATCGTRARYDHDCRTNNAWSEQIAACFWSASQPTTITSQLIFLYLSNGSPPLAFGSDPDAILVFVTTILASIEIRRLYTVLVPLYTLFDHVGQFLGLHGHAQSQI
jgi:hypothetical protein